VHRVPGEESGCILVTGAAGFVGSWLVPQLLASGYDVVACLRPGESPGPAEARWVACELTEPASVAELLGKTRPRGLIHLAAQAVPREAARQPLDALRSNYLAVHYLVDAILRESPATRLLLVSSGEVYGRRSEQAPPARESDPLEPENVYAATKRAAEARLELELGRSRLDWICARPFNHTGPGRPDRYAESSFARQIARAEAGRAAPRVSVGNLTAVRDFSDVRDVARAYPVLLERGTSGRCYNVCSGVGRSVDWVLRQLVARARIPIEIEMDPERFQPTPEDRVALVGDPSALVDLGWRP